MTIAVELALVAGALANPNEAWDLLDAAPRGSVADIALGVVWGIVADLADKGVAPDLARVQQEALARGVANQVGAELAEALAAGGTIDQTRRAALTVGQAATVRRLRGLALGAVQDIDTLSPAQALPAFAASIDAMLRAFTPTGARRTELVQGMVESLHRAEARARGESTARAWPIGLDTIAGPDPAKRRALLHFDAAWTPAPGELVVIGGGTGQGKSALAQYWAMQLVEAGFLNGNMKLGAVYIPLADIDGPAMADRALARLAGRTSWEVSREPRPPDVSLRAMRKAIEAADPWLRERFIVLDGVGRDVEDIIQAVRRERLRMAAMGIELRMLVVDYVQKVTHRGSQGLHSFTVLETVCSRLREQIAKPLEMCVVAASQLNRENNIDGRKTPTMAALKGGSVIEEAADVVAMLHPTPIRWEKKPNDWRKRLKRTELHVLKYRNGAPSVLALITDLATYRYWPEAECPSDVYTLPPPKKKGEKEEGNQEDAQDDLL